MQNNVNQNIKASVVLLIDENGENFGNVKLNDALSKARSVGLDLVEVSSGKGIPVCRIMDFGKWKYEQTKRDKKNKTHQKQELKELKFRPNISENDLQYRAKQVEQFLMKGNKVKLLVRFKGREQEHMYNTGQSVLQRFLDLVESPFSIDSNARAEGNSIVMIIAKQG